LLRRRWRRAACRPRAMFAPPLAPSKMAPRCARRPGAVFAPRCTPLAPSEMAPRCMPPARDVRAAPCSVEDGAAMHAPCSVGDGAALLAARARCSRRDARPLLRRRWRRAARAVRRGVRAVLPSLLRWRWRRAALAECSRRAVWWVRWEAGPCDGCLARERGGFGEARGRLVRDFV